ncbi:sulfate adenylyltransferase [Allopusillimonas ginsengisoli]|uniref:sulfate adenylyltransferase n=1 Tax=Allopusillimonas ginsengisoli TaxID=453575 RepID=UPI0010211498|nr:sulfate adenylyltransferase [Allopusillimonas ginsengisoli]TEA78800.1 sulfate adenylyltransferase [Allopusillimonas ginsengisoli]
MEFTQPFEHCPQQPHGGTLVNRVVPAGKLKAEIERARSMPSIRVDLEAIITIEMITTGVLSPNEGFMNEADYNAVLNTGRLSNGLIWPVPLSFAPTGERNQEVIKGLSVDSEVALTDHHNEPIAILAVEDIFDYDKQARAQQLFGTTDRNHPGVDAIHRRMGDVSLGGKLSLLQRVDWGPFEKLRREPKDTWRLFYEERKFKSVAGFITGANPLHRGHEYMHRNALEGIDGLLLQPLVEMAKREYVRHEYRMLAYRSVLETYYPKERSILSPLRVTYIFAGPRETVLHALIMKNYGCTHALIGRDHAGIGSFYDKYASHSIFDEFSPQEMGIEIRLFHEVFYCARCASHSTIETCPHDERYRLNISGTGIREMLRHGIMPPKEVVRPESALAGMQGIQPKGISEEDGQGTLPVGKVIQSLFPFYTKYTRLGGAPRKEPLSPEDLTVRDLEIANHDARTHANDIYTGIYAEYSSVVDHNRNLHPRWLEEARVDLRQQQERIISDLEEKLQQSPDQASDEFMYQDKAEVERELASAIQLLDDVPASIAHDKLQERIWNVLPYKRYRGAD